MSIESSLQAGFAAVAASQRALRLIITGTATGDLTGLTTTTKASLIAAINELDGHIKVFINDSNNSSLLSTYSAAHIESRLAAVQDAIIGGASSAYDTLLELQQAIQGDQTQLGTLLTAVGNKVAFDQAQSLTTAQKDQARANIGAAAQADLVLTNNAATALTTRVGAAEATIVSHTTLLNNAAAADYASAFNTALNA